MFSKKPKVSVAIPAYNEEVNICRILQNVLGQEEHGFEITEVIVLSDGSTDRTVKFARQIVSRKVKVVAGRKRLGKSSRLNEIFRLFKGDLLVLLDADVRLTSKTVIASLVRPLLKSGKIGLVSGVATPEVGRNIVEQAVNLSVKTYLKYVDKLNGGKTVYAVEGRILALSGEFARLANIPSDTFANDAFLYFLAKKNGFGFKYVKNASVGYRSPATIVDQYRQNLRFAASHHMMMNFFGKTAAEEYRGRKLLLYRLMFIDFLRNPLQGFLIFWVNLYTKARAKGMSEEISACWDVAKSTKGAMNA